MCRLETRIKSARKCCFKNIKFLLLHRFLETINLYEYIFLSPLNYLFYTINFYINKIPVG